MWAYEQHRASPVISSYRCAKDWEMARKENMGGCILTTWWCTSAVFLTLRQLQLPNRQNYVQGWERRWPGWDATVGFSKTSSGPVMVLIWLQSLTTLVFRRSAMAPKPLRLLVLLRFTSCCGCCGTWPLWQGMRWCGTVDYGLVQCTTSREWHSLCDLGLLIQHLEGQDSRWLLSTVPDPYKWLRNTSSHVYQIRKVRRPQIWSLMACLYLSLIIKAWFILISSMSLATSQPHPRREGMISSARRYFTFWYRWGIDCTWTNHLEWIAAVLYLSNYYVIYLCRRFLWKWKYGE